MLMPVGSGFYCALLTCFRYVFPVHVSTVPYLQNVYRVK